MITFKKLSFIEKPEQIKLNVTLTAHGAAKPIVTVLP